MSEQPIIDLNAWRGDQPAPAELAGLVRRFREKLMADPHRPGYHFAVPEAEGIPGDPNAAFFAAGRYHLMYLYRRAGEGFAWGHVSSTDLLHWRHHPDALRPGEGDEGIFSGGVHVDGQGRAIIAYWGLGRGRGIGLAFAHGPDYDVWTKSPLNPVIPSGDDVGIAEVLNPAGNKELVGCADPSNLWRHEGRWYVALGNLCLLNKLGRQPDSRPADQGDRLYLFASADLKKWEYCGLLYEGDRRWTAPSEDCMCASLFPLPARAQGGAASGKHLLLFIAHNRGCQYYIGDFSGTKFVPQVHGRMSRVDNAYFAPEALVDDRGRQIMWAWIFDDRPEELRRASGWTGIFGLPRALWLGDDATLRMAPVDELQSLRLAAHRFGPAPIPADGTAVLAAPPRDLVELELRIRPGTAARCGVQVGCSDQEQTTIFWDRAGGALGVDTVQSSASFGRKAVETLPLVLAAEEELVLRIFLDRGIVEVFANDRQAIGRAIYPAGRGHGVRLFAVGGDAELVSATAWELAPANPF